MHKDTNLLCILEIYHLAENLGKVNHCTFCFKINQSVRMMQNPPNDTGKFYTTEKIQFVFTTKSIKAQVGDHI